jgi:hypothetical protein
LQAWNRVDSYFAKDGRVTSLRQFDDKLVPDAVRCIILPKFGSQPRSVHTGGEFSYAGISAADVVRYGGTQTRM